jgi:citrate synthase
MSEKRGSTSTSDRRQTARQTRGDEWQTALTRIEQNRIVIRGYPMDEIMGRISFAEAIYLLLVGELPTPAIGKVLDALLVSSVDHGATPPSTLAARTVASTGAPLRNTVAAGVLSFGTHHGADVESCMRFLDRGLDLQREGASVHDAAETIIRRCLETGQRPPGFGHRLHTRDPRAVRLLQLALELELDGQHISLVTTVERLLSTRKGPIGESMPLNVDGAIAAVCGDLGFDYEIGNALFIIARVPGLIAHAHEERLRQRPMRQINPQEHVYDGPSDRRLPETRK